MIKRIVKYSLLTAGGVAAFLIVNSRREVAAIGGEGLFVLLPLMWWAVESTIKDTARTFKEIWKGE